MKILVAVFLFVMSVLMILVVDCVSIIAGTMMASVIVCMTATFILGSIEFQDSFLIVAICFIGSYSAILFQERDVIAKSVSDSLKAWDGH